MADYADYSEEYADCYELITQHKSYINEVDALIAFLNAFQFDKKILSVGCGTGSHERYLAKNGFKVFGIDKSKWMINHALSASKGIPNLSFGLTYHDAEKYLAPPFNCIVSLFNVVNCLPDSSSLRDFFKEVFVRMDSGGVFFFEAWNGIECMVDPPKAVFRDFKDLHGSYLNRKAKPILNTSRQHLQIDYEISGCIQGRPVAIKSVHNIRLFTVNEIIHHLSSVGFTCVHVYSSLPSLEPFDFDSPSPPRMLAFSALT